MTAASWSASSPRATSRAAPGPSPDAPAESEGWQESVFAALPLFIIGALCLLLAIDLYLSGTTTAFGGNGSVNLRPWVLFVALGITGIAAGTVALWIENPQITRAEPPKSTPRPPTLVRPTPRPPPTPGAARRSYPGPSAPELAGLSPRPALVRAPPRPTPAAAKPSPPPARPTASAAIWDEDLIGPEESRPGPEEEWDAGSMGPGKVAERMPTDAALRQLDEIEASLRKKTAARRTN